MDDELGVPSSESTEVYAYALRMGSMTTGDDSVATHLGLSATAVDAAIDRLRRLCLLRDQTIDGARRLVPVDPEVAAASLVAPIDEEVYRQRAAINQIRQHLDAFRPYYDRVRTQPTGQVMELRDDLEVVGHLHLAAQACTREVLGFVGTGWGDARPSPAVWAELAERGVRLRLLLPHAVRSQIRARAQLDALIARGAEVRTSGQVPRQIVIFDAAVAVLLHDEPVAGTLGVAIQHPPTVTLLKEVVASAWGSGHAYLADELGYREVADNLHRTIVELLAEGLTDEAIARRLGVSVRTCRRHIAALLQRLDAVSRFQAGVLATATGLLDRDNNPGHRVSRHLCAVG
jgi:DNA-binding CsgD family transcriptional regulator